MSAVLAEAVFEPLPPQTCNDKIAEIRQLIGIIEIEYDYGVQVTVPDAYSVYYYTKAGHPAHLGIVKRSVVQSGDTISVQTTGWQCGSQPEFERWFNEFLKEDEQIRQTLEQQSD